MIFKGNPTKDEKGVHIFLLKTFHREEKKNPNNPKKQAENVNSWVSS